MAPELLIEAQQMAAAVTASLGGNGIWGVEFFIKNGAGKQPGTVYFSELSPRPHDTGMVTLGRTQNFSEFELHARAVLGLPVLKIEHVRNGASAVILAPESMKSSRVHRTFPVFSGLAEAAAVPQTDFRLFSKPTVRPYRRMAVALAFGEKSSDVSSLVRQAQHVASMIQVQEGELY
jgi:phosphoribosylglycinamide formyltransferase 2